MQFVAVLHVDDTHPTMALSSCCGAALERRNDGRLYCSECGKRQSP
jgi:transposase